MLEARQQKNVDKSTDAYRTRRTTPVNFDHLMRSVFRAACVAAISLSAVLVPAQRPAHFEHRDADLVHARELFDKAKYGAAQHEFEEVVARITDPRDLTRTEAEFLSAICAVRLFHNDASVRLLGFIEHHPENAHIEACELELFRYYFQQKRWDDALAWSTKVDLQGLSASDQEEFRFKRGYANFQNGDAEKALGDFHPVQQGTGTYASPATYYAAHINYDRGNYETALQGFNKLKTDESFGKVVPFYIAEILFLQGNYEELQQYVKPLLDDPNGARRIEEINRLAGEAYYRTGKYEEALPYLEKSAQRTGLQRGDRYVLGYTYYRTGDMKKALDQFNLVAAQTDDSLAQMAAYHMADAYLRLNEKNYARNAFKRAYDMGKDPKLTEDALFNYAKLSYELSFDPYHEAILALRNYLKRYPNSPRNDEAQGFLLDVFIKTRNYEDALATLDAMKEKPLPMQEAYQKLAFDRGVELYEGRKYPDAALFFEKALKYPVNKDANARAHYWMGESYFAMDDYDGALRKYDDLRNTSGSFATDLYEQASYSMGYAYFKMKEYDEASTAFRRFTSASGIDAKQKSDALLRIGDCAFVAKDEPTAIQWYDKAMAAGTSEKDYALYQKGVCLGLEQRFTEKIDALKKLLNEKPNSRHAPDAKFQLGETYLNLEQDAPALQYYQDVVNAHPNSPHVRQSMLQSALIHKRQGRPDQALEEFKAIVAKYPTMDGARDALAGIESIYVEQGKVGEYEAYVNTLSFVDPATLDLDEKYYRSAEQLYIADKCAQAVGAFGDYLAKYPNGAFALNAYFYKGDCEYRAGQNAQALTDLEEVIERNGTQFMESALVGASDILFKEERWEGALDRFVQLEQVATVPQNVLAAQVGRMRCLRELGRTAEAATAAEKVAANGTAGGDIKAEAGLAVANGALAKDDLDGAYAKFKAVANTSNNAWGAEAKYNCAYVRHLQKKYRDAEKEVFDLVQKFPAYDHWKAKAFILLGDVYVQLDDRFQAKATLQSVIDHCTEPDLVADAQRRLDAIVNSEVQQTTPAPQDSIEVTLPGNDQ